MEVYLLRHGSSVANEKKLVCGSLDFPLSDKGVEQAKNVCNYLNSITFNYIYTSPLSRAVNTIEFLQSNVIPRVSNQLKELNTGSFSNMTLPDLWEMDSRYRRPWLIPDVRYPDGETFREMITRIMNWYIKNNLQWLDDDKILIVGHEGTLRTIYLYLNGLNISDYPEFPIGNCDLLCFKLEKNQVLEYFHIKLK